MKTNRKKHFSEIAVLLFLLLSACSSRYAIITPQYGEYQGEVNHHTRLIKASRERVFKILTREETFQKICPEGTRVTCVSPYSYKEGTQLNTKIDHIFDLEWNTQIKEINPNKRIRLQFLDGFFAGGTEIWELREEGEFCRVSHTIIVEPRGFLRKSAWIFKVRGKHDKMVEIFLDNLKNFSEAEDVGEQI